MFADRFASIALAVSGRFGGPYHDACATWSGDAELDDGGSIVTPGAPVSKDCSVQVDSVTEAMRGEAGYTDKDMRLLVLASTLDGDLDTDASIEVLAGPHFGTWMLASVNRDPVGAYWEGRGRLLSATVSRFLEGAIGAGSAITGELSAFARLSGEVSAVATISGDLTAAARLSGSVTTDSAIEGTLTAAARLEGNVSSGSALSGEITATATLAGAVSALATLTGALTEIFAGHALALDFKNSAYRHGSTEAVTPTPLPGYSYSRAGAKSELSAAGAPIAYAANVPGIVPTIGVWVRPAFTNIFQNSAVGVTQSRTVTAQAYTLSFFGTGTITLTGTSTAGPLVGTGAANRVSLSFTPTAGSLTLTVTGSCTDVCLVAGTLAGPVIATGAASATVNADSGPMFTLPTGISTDLDFAIWAVMTAQELPGGYAISLTDLSANNEIAVRFNGTSTLVTSTAAGVAQTGVGSGGAILTAGRSVVLIRRRSGKWTACCRNAAGTNQIGVEGGASTYPTGMTRIQIGSRWNNSVQVNAAIAFVGVRLGTFSDADLGNIMAAA